MEAIYFIVTTSQFSNGFYIHSKYDQLYQMYTASTKKRAIEIAESLNKRANEEFNDSIILTENKHYSLGVDKFITNY